MLTLTQYKFNHMLLTIQVVFEPFVPRITIFCLLAHLWLHYRQCACLDITDISDASVTLGVHALVSEVVS